MRTFCPAFCGLPHDRATGRPRGHTCIVMHPMAIRAELDGDLRRAATIMRAERARRQRAARAWDVAGVPTSTHGGAPVPRGDLG